MKTAVQFGAGNIGRGFLGQVFFESGYETVFVDVSEGLVDALNARGEYPLRIVEEPPHTLRIGNVRAIHGRDIAAVAQAVAGADIAATAVGVPVMGVVAASLAAGIEKRFQRADAPPLDIIICENMVGAGPFMREKVRESLPPELHPALDSSVGFVEASIGRMVPVQTEAIQAEDALMVAVEAYCDLPVDKEAFRGAIPPLAHLIPQSSFAAYVERKLFLHNMGHAVAAYIGAQRGYAYIWEAMADPDIAAVVAAAMDESCRALSLKHGLDLSELREHAADLRRRFSNRALGDQIARVARDPIRKLGPNDRLIGAMRLCLAYGITPECISAGTAAALCFYRPDDPSALDLQAIQQRGGWSAVLSKVCGVHPGSPVAEMILAHFLPTDSGRGRAPV